MGNNKSSHQLSNSFDKDTEFNSEADDGGFLEAKLKATSPAALRRGQAGRKSFHYIRLKENHELPAGKPNGNGTLSDKDQLMRVHSLPASRIKKKSNTLGAKKEANGRAHNKIPVQGFDMFRHHIGQMHCDIGQFQELETEIHLLNEKLCDLEQTRQSCLDKLNKLSEEVKQNQLFASVVDQKMSSKKGKANDLALRIIQNYVQRIDNLLRLDEEPFLLDVKGISTATTTSQSRADVNQQSLSSQLEQSIKVEPNGTSAAANSTARSKRQQIKEAYNHLIRSIMPRLFGKQFAHRSEANYVSFKQNLTDLREQVSSISTSDEQKLLDAKRIFLSEVDGYLGALDKMITCEQKECDKCRT